MRTADVCPPCPVYVSAECVIYNGDYLETLDITPGDNVQQIIEIINNFLDGISVVIPEIPGFTLDEALDNQYHLRRYAVGPYDDGTDADIVATRINVNTLFSVNEIQIPVFKVVNLGARPSGPLAQQPPLYEHTWTLKEPYGKGNYGVGSGTTLTGNDLILWSSKLVNEPEAITDLDNTQVINLGDIGSSTVAEALNGLVTCIDIQNQEDGYTIFNATINGSPVQYLFIGTSGSYGAVCNTSTEADFVELNSFIEENGPTITNTSQLINDGENGVDPFITASEVFTPNSIINNQAGVNHVANYSFEAWARSYYINNVRYNNDYVFNNIELSEPHPVFDRTDTFVVQNHNPSVGVLSLQSGGAGQMTTVEVDAVDILGVPVAFNTDLTTTATYIVNQINTYCVANELPFNARNDGQIIYIYDRTGAPNDGQVLTYTATTLTATASNFAGGNTTKTTAAITGVASANPYEPVPLFTYQTRISAIDVAAGSTAPGTDQVFTQIIYDENAGTGGGEWNQGLTTVGIDVDSTSVTPATQSGGTKITEIPDTVLPNLPAQIIWQDLGNPLQFDYVQGKIKFLFWTTTIILTNGWDLEVTLQNTASSNFVKVNLDYLGLITHGWGIQAGTWYTITINLSEFPYLTDGEFDRIYFKFSGSPLCFIDRVQYQSSFPITQPGVTPDLQQVTNVGNVTTNTMQTPSILSDQLTQTNWFRATQDYFSLGDFGDGAGDAYGGSWNKYVSFFDPNNNSNTAEFYHLSGGNSANIYMRGDLANARISGGSPTRSAIIEVNSGLVNINQNEIGVGLMTLNILPPIINGHIYTVPARADAATTSYLALGAILKGGNQYANSVGLIDLTGLPVDLQDATDNGNTTDNDIIISDGVNARTIDINGNTITASVGGMTIDAIHDTSLNLLSYETVGAQVALELVSDTGLYINTKTGQSSANRAILSTGNITTARTFNFPDANGTFAVGATDGVTTVLAGTNGLVDISSITTLDTVTDNGNSTTNSISVNTITTITYTVASLPSGTIGQRSFVTDSNVVAAGNFGNVVAGGGANGVPVYYDGANWRIG